MDFLTALGTGILSNFAFLFITIILAYLVYLIFRRGPLYEFWGLQDVKKIRIYVSHLRVVIGHPECPDGTVGGAIGPDGVLRSFQGSVAPQLETEMAGILRGLFFVSLPGWAVLPAWLKSLLLTNADAEIRASPVDGSTLDPDGTVISLGSPGYNYVSQEIETTCACPVRFTNDNQSIELPGKLEIRDGRKGVIVRLRYADRYWFYAAGLSEGGTAAAAYSLATLWRRLHKKYRKTPSFYAVVEFVGDDFRTARIISEGPLYER